MQTENRTGSKNLFDVYQRGEYDENGTRVDVMSYQGTMGRWLECLRSDGSMVWQYVIHTTDITYTTVMYATNVRPLPVTEDDGPDSIIAYVQTNIKLAWTLSRIAILNFVIASQSIYTPKMIVTVGRVIVEFDFAIVEPYVTEDGTADPSRTHLEMGISTYTPLANTSLLVFMGEDFMSYEAEMAGNTMTEILQYPPTIIEDTPGCSYQKVGYCRQKWEFEFILELNMTLLSEEKPMDASGVFTFQYDSFYCEDLIPHGGCTPHGLPLWNVSADVTLQTVVDVVDEDMDVVAVSVVEMTNDKGEDLRGGSGVKHMENVTLEVNISPAFLRDRYMLELDLFMVCIGEGHSESTQGCLGATDTERYTAFVADDFEMEYDPMQDPAYLKTISTVPAVDFSPTSAIAFATEPPRYVSMETTRQFMLIGHKTRDTLLLPASELLPSDVDNIVDSFFLQTFQFPSEEPKDRKVLLNIGPTDSFITDESRFEEIAIDSNIHQEVTLFMTFFDAMPPSWIGDPKSQLFAAYLALPGSDLSYFGFTDPDHLPCGDFPKLEHRHEYLRQDLVEFTPNLETEDVVYLRNVESLYQTLTSLHLSAQNWKSLSGTKESFLQGQLWNMAMSEATHLLTNVTNSLTQLILDTVWETTINDSLPVVQNLVKAFILFEPLQSTQLITEDFQAILSGLESWLSHKESMILIDVMAEVVRVSVLDGPQLQATILPLVALYEPIVTVLPTLFPDEDDFSAVIPNLVFEGVTDFEVDESFYDLLFNLTVGNDGHMDGISYISASGTEEAEDVIGFRVDGCVVDWDYTSSLWVYTEPQMTSEVTLAGGWGNWLEWASCSTSCEGGSQSRERQCLDPQVPCSGVAMETRACNELRCGLYRDMNDLVHDVILSREVMTFTEMSEYCRRMQAHLISYPHSTEQDEYLLQRIQYAHLDHIWISSQSTSSCRLLRKNGELISAECTDLFHGFCIKDFVLVFDAFAGNDESISMLWDNRDKADSFNGGNRRNSHFLDTELIRMWNRDTYVKEVQLAVYDVDDQLVLDLRFDGADTKPHTWFSAATLTSAWPYTDLTTAEETPNFQIHTGNRDGNERFLSVDKNLGKCEERSGWLMVIDGDVEFACDWQVSAAYPLILFSRRTSGSNWNSGTNTGKASRLAVFVQYYMHEPPVPAVTHPGPIVYTSDVIQEPEDWQELNYQEYDHDKQVHRSDFTNFAMSADTAVYTMTAVYTVIEKPGRGKRQLQPRTKRNIMKSIKYPKMKSLPFTFVGCPNNSAFNPSYLMCDCRAPLADYDVSSFSCESVVQLSTTDVMPTSASMMVKSGIALWPFLTIWYTIKFLDNGD
ncbi:uncharacterized protein [Apostichopus japonicus]